MAYHNTAMLYSQRHSCNPAITEVKLQVDDKGYKGMAKIISDIYEGKLLPEDLHDGLMSFHANKLWEGVQEGTGDYFKTQNEKDLEFEAFMKENVFLFSGYKTYQELKNASELLLDDEGNIKKFSQYKKDVLKTTSDYDVKFLRAEYDHAIASGQMAVKWQRKVKTGGNLKYITAGDARVRNEHKELNGVIKNVDDDFWNSHYPPNGWGCRCTVSSTLSDETTKEDTPTITIPPLFRNNVGKDGIVFSEKHPYFEDSKGVGKRIENKVSELLEEYSTIDLGDNPKKGSLKVHKDAHKNDIDYNIKYGKLIAKLGYDIKIAKHSEINKVKNPEVIINGKIGDFKEIKNEITSNNVQKAIGRANKQKAESVIIIDEKKSYSIHELANGLKMSLCHKKDDGSPKNSNIKEVYLYFNRELKYFTRKEIEDYTYLDKL